MIGNILLLDGGLGQEIQKRSSEPASPLWSVNVMMNAPEIVEAVHADFIDAGAKVITLNTYTASPERLTRDGAIDLFEALHAQAIAIARLARDKSGKTDLQIAGCLPPLMASYRSDVVPDKAQCLSSYRRIVEQQAAGVDYFLCETLTLPEEIETAVMAAKESGKPVIAGMTAKDGEGHLLRSGLPIQRGIEAAIGAGAHGVVVNCSWPESITQAMKHFKAVEQPYGAYANGFTSIDALNPGGTVDSLTAREDLDPEKYSDHALSWVKNGASIVGGCCEVGPAHIKRLAERLIENGYGLTGNILDLETGA